MILTGKALEDFKNWYWTEWFEDKERKHYSFNKESAIEGLYHTDIVFLNALIIEWFDSVGIIINILNQDLQMWFYYEIKTIEKIKGFELVKTRQKATEQAIIKANDIYNER